MANELKVTTSVVYENGQLKYTHSPGTLQLPQAAAGYSTQVVTATSAEAAVTLAGITAPGMLVLQSLEATTTGTAVDFGVTSTTGGMGNPFGTLEPRSQVVTNLNSTSTLRVKNEGAAAGNVDVLVIAFEA